MMEINIALCEGRHEIPQAINGSIFQNISNVTDVVALENIAKETILDFSHYCREQGCVCPCYGNGNSIYCDTQAQYECGGMGLQKVNHINLYVTGLTVCLIATLNVCRELGITVTLYHFDRETNSYYPQEVR